MIDWSHYNTKPKYTGNANLSNYQQPQQIGQPANLGFLNAIRDIPPLGNLRTQEAMNQIHADSRMASSPNYLLEKMGGRGIQLGSGVNLARMAGQQFPAYAAAARQGSQTAWGDQLARDRHLLQGLQTLGQADIGRRSADVDRMSINVNAQNQLNNAMMQLLSGLLGDLGGGGGLLGGLSGGGIGSLGQYANILGV